MKRRKTEKKMKSLSEIQDNIKQYTTHVVEVSRRKWGGSDKKIYFEEIQTKKFPSLYPVKMLQKLR